MPFTPVDGDENNFHYVTGANSIDCVAFPCRTSSNRRDTASGFGVAKSLKSENPWKCCNFAGLQEWSDKLGRYGPRTLSCRSVQVAPV
jgi:hypothetical protein